MTVSLSAVHILVDDPDAALGFYRDTLGLTVRFEKVAAAPGAEVLQEPVSQPWGARDAVVRDPAGNLVRIEQG